MDTYLPLSLSEKLPVLLVALSKVVGSYEDFPAVRILLALGIEQILAERCTVVLVCVVRSHRYPRSESLEFP